MRVTEASRSLLSEQPARIHPEGVDGRKARGKRGSALPRDNQPPLEGALVRARDIQIRKPTVEQAQIG
jgi:hypothetical protein